MFSGTKEIRESNGQGPLAGVSPRDEGVDTAAIEALLARAHVLMARIQEGHAARAALGVVLGCLESFDEMAHAGERCEEFAAGLVEAQVGDASGHVAAHLSPKGAHTRRETVRQGASRNRGRSGEIVRTDASSRIEGRTEKRRLR